MMFPTTALPTGFCSCTRNDMDHYVPDLGHDESDWPLTGEVMFIGAIMCERPGEPAQRFHPMARHVFPLDEAI